MIAGDPDVGPLETAADVVRLGRADTADLRLGAHHVSADHASIAFTESGYVLRDHHSTNGTRIERDGETIELASSPGRERGLRTADVICLGTATHPVRIEVRIEDETETADVVSMRPVDEIPRVEAEARADREVLRSLYDAVVAIGAADELDEVLDAVAAQVFALLDRATHVTVALREEEEGGRGKAPRYVPIGTRVKGRLERVEAVPITRSVFRKVVSNRAAVLAADARRDVGESASMLAAAIVSTIGIPLWKGEEILGVLQVDNRARPGMFREADLDRLALLAQAASQAFARAQLLSRLRAAEERQRTENVYLKRTEERRRFEGIVGEAPAMRRLLEQIRKVADTRVTVLIQGETGTGKELAASAVHYWSARKDQLFVAQNCAALPENLLESELFGHKKGAFTGATEDKKGLFELANGGTLFLDEVGEMPLSLQAKLLRVLQDGEIRPVGASQVKRVDVRIVAATNRDLEEEVRAGRFREDLFYRLGVFPVRMPPLRERREDVPALAAHFLRKYAEEFGRNAPGFSQQAMELLQDHDWPGNVRELQNEVQRLLIQVGDGSFVGPEDLSPRIRKAENVVARVRPEKGTLREMMEQVEKWILAEALREHDQNKSATAKTLGITREGLHKKLRGYGMS
ncbi:MAG: sigma 54-interacting transcriptional regulator [Polyangiales bacterium]